MRRNKIYERREPTKDGKLYFIFCEGDDREATYFHFFNKNKLKKKNQKKHFFCNDPLKNFAIDFFN